MPGFNALTSPKLKTLAPNQYCIEVAQNGVHTIIADHISRYAENASIFSKKLTIPNII